MIDIRLGYIQVTENIEIFKVKLSWSKSSRLLFYFTFYLNLSVSNFCVTTLINENISANNHGRKVGDKFTKLNKTGFSMECFTPDFLKFFIKKRQNLAIGWTAGYSPSYPSISGIFLKFPNFLRS